MSADPHAAGELLQLAYLYAKAMDRNEPALLEQVLADDAEIAGPGFVMQGLARSQQSPAMLQSMYLLTQHVVHNQTVTITGDTAKGETYCTANHVFRPEDNGTSTSALIWAIRYQDSFARGAHGWRFTRRELIIDWSETRPVTLGVGG